MRADESAVPEPAQMRPDEHTAMNLQEVKYFFHVIWHSVHEVCTGAYCILTPLQRCEMKT